MERFTVHTGTVAVMERENIDTDQIIPKQFLKRVERSGYGDVLFFDWRYDREGKPDAAFPLNAPQYRGASILLAGKNFGCGSSREHAVWALRDYGFCAIIAPSFADIFANNCLKNGILTVVLRPSEIVQLLARDSAGLYRVKIDLEQCKVSGNSGFQAHFEIDAFSRTCLLEGLDEIGTTLKHEAEIAKYEQKRRNFSSLN